MHHMHVVTQMSVNAQSCRCSKVKQVPVMFVSRLLPAHNIQREFANVGNGFDVLRIQHGVFRREQLNVNEPARTPQGSLIQR